MPVNDAAHHRTWTKTTPFIEITAAQVLLSRKVKVLSQGSEHATVTINTPNGQTTLRAEYVIGCDGATSVVPKLLGLEFEGHTWPERFIATNVHDVFAKHGWKNVHMISSGPVWGLVAKINNTKAGCGA